jgi:hypothetical protein
VYVHNSVVEQTCDNTLFFSQMVQFWMDSLHRTSLDSETQPISRRISTKYGIEPSPGELQDDAMITSERSSHSDCIKFNTCKFERKNLNSNNSNNNKPDKINTDTCLETGLGSFSGSHTDNNMQQRYRSSISG